MLVQRELENPQRSETQFDGVHRRVIHVPDTALELHLCRALSSDQALGLSPTRAAVASSFESETERLQMRASSSLRSRSEWISGASPAK